LDCITYNKVNHRFKWYSLWLHIFEGLFKGFC